MSQVLLCLHGWGGSKESFADLRNALKDTDLEILTPDLPGFGSEPEPDRPWSVDDYADWVQHRINEQQETRNQQAIMLLGHSHGGRIALKLAARQSMTSEQRATHSTSSGQANNEKRITRNEQPVIEHLYLCASAGIYHRRPIRRAIGFLLAKTGKILLAIRGLLRLEPLAKRMLYKVLRVHDYERASPVMRETLQRVRDEDLTPLLPSIAVPTDIFWGTDDTMTPFKDGRLMHRLIKDSTLHVFRGVRHRVHRDRAQEIATVIRSQMT